MPSHRRKWRCALFSSVYAWEHQYSYISGRTRLLRYDLLRFLRECDSPRGVKRAITTTPGFQVSTVSWWSIHSYPAFILHSLRSRQLRKVSLRGASLGNQKVLPPYIWMHRIVFMLYVFVQTFLFTKEHLPLSRWTRRTHLTFANHGMVALCLGLVNQTYISSGSNPPHNVGGIDVAFLLHTPESPPRCPLDLSSDSKCTHL
jgi:hypothetical protein